MSSDFSRLQIANDMKIFLKSTMSFSKRAGTQGWRPTEQHPRPPATMLVKALALCFPFRILWHLLNGVCPLEPSTPILWSHHILPSIPMLFPPATMSSSLSLLSEILFIFRPRYRLCAAWSNPPVRRCHYYSFATVSLLDFLILRCLHAAWRLEGWALEPDHSESESQLSLFWSVYAD